MYAKGVDRYLPEMRLRLFDCKHGIELVSNNFVHADCNPHLDCSPQIYRPAQCPTSDCCVVCRRSSGQCLQRLPSSGEAGPSLSSGPQGLLFQAHRSDTVLPRTQAGNSPPGAGLHMVPALT